MEIILAGFNVDKNSLEALSKGRRDNIPLTPETICAAYARISRSPKSVTQLRQEAVQEVENARDSNRRIIFEMGHHSVAEHAVFNFDILGISRLAVEEIEKFRLCSFTEKSQRYITLADEYVLPQEIRNTRFEKEFGDLIHLQNGFYRELYDSLKPYVFEKYSHLLNQPAGKRTVEGLAKEDARYITCLATQAQLGLTLNARNLELMLRRFASSQLAEVQEMGEKLFSAVKNIAPSIILFCDANNFDQKTYPELKELSGKIIGGNKEHNACRVKLLTFTADADNRLLASLLYTGARASYADCLARVGKMTSGEKRDLIKTAFAHMQFYDCALREFEHIHLTFELVLSASCYAQLKRHRMSTQTCQPYDPALGITIPESIAHIGKEERFRQIIARTEETYHRLSKNLPAIAPYILTNAHRRKVLLTLNARELYHISRLREDSSAQWDIRALTGTLLEEAKKKMPLTFLVSGGKDKYPQTYEGVFGKLPRVCEVPPCGAK